MARAHCIIALLEGWLSGPKREFAKLLSRKALTGSNPVPSAKHTWHVYVEE